MDDKDIKDANPDKKLKPVSLDGKSGMQAVMEGRASPGKKMAEALDEAKEAGRKINMEKDLTDVVNALKKAGVTPAKPLEQNEALSPGAEPTLEELKKANPNKSFDEIQKAYEKTQKGLEEKRQQEFRQTR